MRLSCFSRLLIYRLWQSEAVLHVIAPNLLIMLLTSCTTHAFFTNTFADSLKKMWSHFGFGNSSRLLSLRLCRPSSSIPPLCFVLSASPQPEDSNFPSALKFTAIATRVRVHARECFQSCMRCGEREGKQRQRGDQTRCAVERRRSRPCVFLSGCGARNVSKLNHFHPRAKPHTLCSQLRALCLSILVIICLPASLLVALGNAHLSLD